MSGCECHKTEPTTCRRCLTERLGFVIKQRDEARAEVERLKVELQVAPDRWAELLATSEQRVAERQREACAGAARHYSALRWHGEALEEKVRKTPLVTEVDK